MNEAEKHVQREIQLALGAEPDLLLMRNQNGRARYVTDEGEEFFVPYGLGPGSPDLVGILEGRWFCLEVKDHDGTLSDEQKACHPIWRRFGAYVGVARSVQDARHHLNEARRAFRVVPQATSKKGKR